MDSISDFKITVTLDSSSAIKLLRTLQKKLEELQKKMNSLTSETAGFKDELEKVNKEQERAPKLVNKWAAALRGVKWVAGGVATVFRGIGRAALGTLKFLWGWKYVLLGIVGTMGLLIAKITKTGAKVQSSEIAMKAAVGITMSADGKLVDPQKLLEQQMGATNFAKNLSAKFGFDLADTTSSFAKFFTAAAPQIGGDSAQNFFESFSKVATIFGLDKERVSRSMMAFQQMADKGQVMAEELKQQLAEQLPGAMIIFARAATKLGKYGKVDVDKLMKLMEQGLLKSSELLPLVGQEMESLVGDSGALSEALKSTTVQINRLTTAWDIFQTGASRQFNPEIAALLSKFTDILSGKGFQTTIGVQIKKLVQTIDEALQPVFDFFARYEAEWKKATNQEKVKMMESFWLDLGKSLGEVFGNALESALNKIKQADLKPFADMLANLLVETVKSAWGLFMGDTTKPQQSPVNQFDVAGENTVGRVLSFRDTQARFFDETLARRSPAKRDAQISQQIDFVIDGQRSEAFHQDLGRRNLESLEIMVPLSSPLGGN